MSVGVSGLETVQELLLLGLERAHGSDSIGVPQECLIFRPLCGELMILAKLAIRHTHIWTAPERKTVSEVR
jgi:hypothetical protein